MLACSVKRYLYVASQPAWAGRAAEEGNHLSALAIDPATGALQAPRGIEALHARPIHMSLTGPAAMR